MTTCIYSTNQTVSLTYMNIYNLSSISKTSTRYTKSTYGMTYTGYSISFASTILKYSYFSTSYYGTTKASSTKSGTRNYNITSSELSIFKNTNGYYYPNSVQTWLYTYSRTIVDNSYVDFSGSIQITSHYTYEAVYDSTLTSYTSLHLNLFKGTQTLTTGTTYLTRSSTSGTTYLTRSSTSNTIYLTRTSTSGYSGVSSSTYTSY